MVLTQTLFLIIEKGLTSGSRFALIFYALGSLDRSTSNNFFYITTATTLLMAFCHLGTDNLIIGKKINEENVAAIFFVRFISTCIAILLFLFFFNFEISNIARILMIFALLGTSQPITQLNALIDVKGHQILINRVAPELLSGLVRVVAMASGCKDVNILVMSFFAPEIIYGILNLPHILKESIINNLKINLYIEKGLLKTIVWSFFAVVFLYFIQRGDVLLLTSSSEILQPGVENVIRYQQFFDMSGLIAIAAVPVLKKIINRKKSPAMLIILAGLGASIVVFGLIELLSFNNSFGQGFEYIMKGIPSYQVSIFFGLGLITYCSMTHLGLISKQKLIGQLMLGCIAFKVICFYTMLDLNNAVFYSFVSSLFFASVFIVCAWRRENYKQISR